MTGRNSSIFPHRVFTVEINAKNKICVYTEKSDVASAMCVGGYQLVVN